MITNFDIYACKILPVSSPLNPSSCNPLLFNVNSIFTRKAPPTYGTFKSSLFSSRYSPRMTQPFPCTAHAIPLVCERTLTPYTQLSHHLTLSYPITSLPFH